MAKVKVLGRAVVVTSDLKLEDIQLAESIAPSSLKLVDAESKEVLFQVGAGKNCESINDNGAIFSQDNMITVLVGGNKPITRKDIKDLLGNAIIKLGRVEKQVAKELPSIEKELDKVISFVEVEGEDK